MDLFNRRQGQMEYEEIYFFTATIEGWKLLLQSDEYKMIVINSLKYLVDNRLIIIYAFSIMPNHVHFIWELQKANRKESPQNSFLKFTGHEFKKSLQLDNPKFLEEFRSTKTDRQFQFWKRDPLAIPISSENIFLQKLEYIHHNAVSGKWSLSSTPEQYRWSSARYYHDGYDEFNLITDFRDAGFGR